ncbi:MAG: hypothetical protein ACFB0G_14315 [Leptolyngbyaceae cyanobacterium]|mgnify:CR=1 FL=1
MTNFEPNRFPSRMFVRFIARKQLIADATGLTTILKAQRRGKGLFYQQFVPDRAVPAAMVSDDLANQSLAASPALNGRSQAADNRESVPQLTQSDPAEPLDEALLAEICQTTLAPQHWPAFYQACATAVAATELELEAAADIVTTYRRLKANQSIAIVQQLNQWLAL